MPAQSKLNIFGPVDIQTNFLAAPPCSIQPMRECSAASKATVISGNTREGLSDNISAFAFGAASTQNRI
jgi:hypothetical protein